MQFAQKSLSGLLLLTLALLGTPAVFGQIYNWDTGGVIPGTEAITPGPSVDLRYWASADKNLRYADLAGGLDMHDARFNSSWLEYARFTDANLLNAAFGSAKLTEANFSGANLNAAKFGSADLTNANLTNTNLRNARFGEAILTGADLTGALIDGALFNRGDRGEGTSLTAAQLYSTASYANGDLHGVEFAYHNLTGWNMSGLDLTDTYFYGSTLNEVNFSGSNLDGAYGKGAELRNANLSGVSFVNGIFSESDLTNVDFSNSDLTNAILNSSDFTNGNLTGAIIKDAWLPVTGLTAEQVYSTASYQAGDLRGLVLWGNDLSGWQFMNRNLNGATLRWAKLIDADLSGATLTNIRFEEAVFAGANLTGATIAGSEFQQTVKNGFKAEQLYSTASYATGDLQGVNLSENALTGWDFAGKDLTDAVFDEDTLTIVDFSGANLTRASFDGATCRTVDFVGADLTDANFHDAALIDVDFTDAQIRGANFNPGSWGTGLTLWQLYSTASYQAGDLQQVNLSSNELEAIDLADMNLSQASFSRAQLTDADLSGANCTGTSFKNAVLTGANLSDAIIAEANFVVYPASAVEISETQLRSTASFQARDLHGVILDGADLTGWDFSKQDLSGASIGQATLVDTEFTDAIISGINLASTTQLGFTEAQFQATASYQQGALRGVNLAGNDLSGWDFTGQNLDQAIFRGATLDGADFSDALLTDVDFDNAKIDWNNRIDLTRADLRGVSTYYFDIRLGDLHNTISQYGQIGELDLGAGETLFIRDYAGDMAVSVAASMKLAADSELAIIFSDADWGSTISVNLLSWRVADLDGALSLDFAPGTNVTSLVGTTFDVFDWNGFLAEGDTFAEVTWPAGYEWDISDLYVGGTVTLLSIPEPATLFGVALAALMLRRR